LFGRRDSRLQGEAWRGGEQPPSPYFQTYPRSDKINKSKPKSAYQPVVIEKRGGMSWFWIFKFSVDGIDVLVINVF